MSVDVDSVLVYGVKLSDKTLKRFVRECAEKKPSSVDYFDEFVDSWEPYLVRLDGYNLESDWLFGIYITAPEPLQRTLGYKEYRHKFEDALTEVFPRMPDSLQYVLCEQSGFIIDVRWH